VTTTADIETIYREREWLQWVETNYPFDDDIERRVQRGQMSSAGLDMLRGVRFRDWAALLAFNWFAGRKNLERIEKERAAEVRQESFKERRRLTLLANQALGSKNPNVRATAQQSFTGSHPQFATLEALQHWWALHLKARTIHKS
jgi:hypothetical protein